MSAPTKPRRKESEKVRVIPAGEFKAKCLGLIDEMNEKKLTLIITKRGRPVMQATTPPKPIRAGGFIGATAGSIKVLGDIVSALPNEWNAEAAE